MDIDEPLKEIPFGAFTHRLGDTNIENKINDSTSIFGYFRRTHFFTRAADRFWNRAFRKEDKTESEHGLYGEEVPTPKE